MSLVVGIVNDEDIECLKLEYKNAMSALLHQMEEALVITKRTISTIGRGAVNGNTED